jgi:integrase
MRREYRELIRRGLDPIEHRKAEKAQNLATRAVAMTFDECAAAYIRQHEASWRNPKHHAQWQSTLKTYASPIVGRLSVAEIDTPHIMKVLEPIWTSKPETASRVRGRIESILDWATVSKFRAGDNPARWGSHLAHLLPALSKIRTVEHHAALDYRELPSFKAELRQREGVAALALEFAILTAARSGEVRGMTWDEIRLREKLWVIPAEGMKGGREHRVPLCERALAILEHVKSLAHDKDATEIGFPGNGGKPLSDMSLTAVLRRMGRVELTAHGFRSSFRDWCAEQTNFPSEVAEMALAHAVGDKVEAAYRRGDLFQKRAKLMQSWAAYCDRPQAASKVVPLHA